MKVIKRDGREVEFDKRKIVEAIKNANTRVEKENQSTLEKINIVADYIESKCNKAKYYLSVEEIQDLVETQLMRERQYYVAREYVRYRYSREIARKFNTTDKSILSLIEESNEEIKQENSNKNAVIASTQRDYMAGEVSKDISKRFLLPQNIVEANDEGIIHFHDMDYFIQHMYNCCLINLEDMLQNGTVINGTKIDTPKSFLTACTVATQIIAQVASVQYGGQSISLTHLAPFVRVSFEKYKAIVRQEGIDNGIDYTEEQIISIAKSRTAKEIKDGVQTIQYQVETLMTTNGQAPFITIFMYLGETEEYKYELAQIIEEVIKQRYKGIKNEKGVYITPAFPKLIYVLEESNIHDESEFYYLTKLAAQCTSKRLVPDYISEKKMKELKEGGCFPPMGCRSVLAPYVDENNKQKWYGRFNQGVVTINLPDVALSSKKDVAGFWEIFDERLELCKEALLLRHERLKGTTSDVAPILWQHGAIARLEKGETIDELLYNGYSTISLGYAGIAECTKYMTGESNTSNRGHDFAIEVMRYMYDKCNVWKQDYNVGFSLYGTPLESTTYKFAKALQRRHGVIEGVSDKNYITNSYHVHVTEQIDAFSKLKFESEFQDLSTGGCISYVELPNMDNNLEANMQILKFIYYHLMYGELNTKSDYCHVCGYDGEIKIEKKDNKLFWRCPQCGNEDENKMNVARRTCGYVGTHFWNQGRTQEILDRALHLGAE